MPFVESINTTNANSVSDHTGWQGTQYLSVIPRDELTGEVEVLNRNPMVLYDVNVFPGYQLPVNRAALNGIYPSPSAGVKRGMRCVLYTDDIKRPLDNRRIRTDNTLEVNEGDTPYAAIGDLRAAVLNDYMIREKFPFYNSGTNTQFKDYDIAFHRPNPLIYDLEGAYIAYTSNSGASFSLSPQAYKVEAGLFQTAITWEWDLEDGSFTSGTSTSREITASFPTGFRWINVTATFVHTGRSTTRYIPIWVHHPAEFPPVLGFNGANITGDIDNGYNATIEVFNVEDALFSRDNAIRKIQPKYWIDNALCVVWTVNDYQFANVSVNKGYALNGYDDNNCAIDFIGRVSTDTTGQDVDIQHANLNRPVQLQVDGIAEQLRKTPAVSLVFTDAGNNVANEWDEITLNTVYRSTAHYISTMTTIPDTVSVEFDTNVSLSNDPYRIGYPIQIKDGDVYSALEDLLDSISAKMQFSPQGEIKIAKDARLHVPVDDIPVIGPLSNADIFDYTLQTQNRPRVSRVAVVGGSWNENTSEVDVFRFSFPEYVQSWGLQKIQKTNAIFERNTASWFDAFSLARRLYDLNNAQYTLTITFPDGYHFLTPSIEGVYTFTLDGADNERGYSFGTETKWMLVNITHQHDNQTGTRNVTATFANVRDDYTQLF